MKKTLVLVMGMLFFGQVFAQKIEKIVEDKIDILTEEQENALANEIKNLSSDHTKIVIYIDSKSDQDIFDFSQGLYDENEIGGSNDDGVLFVILLDSKKMRIHTGYGAESFLPDAICNRILVEIVKPYFKDKRYYEGIDAGLSEIISKFEAPVVEKVEEYKLSNEAARNIIIIFLSIISLIFGIPLYKFLSYTYEMNKKKYAFIKFVKTFNEMGVHFKMYNDEYSRVKNKFFFKKYENYNFIRYLSDFNYTYDVCVPLLNSMLHYEKHTVETYISFLKHNLKILQGGRFETVIVQNIDAMFSLGYKVNTLLAIKNDIFIVYERVEKLFQNYDDVLGRYQIYYEDEDKINLLLSYSSYLNSDAQKLIDSIKSEKMYDEIIQLYTKYNNSYDLYDLTCEEIKLTCDSDGIMTLDEDIMRFEKNIHEVTIEAKKYEDVNIEVIFKDHKSLKNKEKVPYKKYLIAKYKEIKDIPDHYVTWKDMIVTYQNEIAQYIIDIRKYKTDFEYTTQKYDIDTLPKNEWETVYDLLKGQRDDLKSTLKQYTTVAKKASEKAASTSYTSSTSNKKDDDSSSDSYSSNWGSTNNDSSWSSNSGSSSSNNDFFSGGGDSGGGGASESW